jgi:hypothetical protein
MKRFLLFVLASVTFFPLTTGCGGGSSSRPGASDPPEPSFAAAQFVSGIDNLFFPLDQGAGSVFEGRTSAGLVRVEAFVSHVTREISGVDCVGVVVRELLDDDLVRETFGWYAQDTEGNVWYLGKDTREIRSGAVVNTEGSWETGKDGARPAIVVKAAPEIGDSYQRDYLPGQVEALGEIVDLDARVNLAIGVSYSCLKVRDWSPEDPDAPSEYRYYTPGVGLVLEERDAGGDRLELVESTLDTVPAIDPADFVPYVDHPLFRLAPGMVFTFAGETDEGSVVIELTVLNKKKTILGVECVIVEGKEYHDGTLFEFTHDWYAQDVEGNVWYMGEKSTEYDEDGEPVDVEDSWQAGVDNAQPGLIMKAEPRVGDTYRQEYYQAVAQDMGEVVATDEVVSLSDGTQHICLKVREWSPLDPGVEEFKYYAPGVGLVLESLTDGSNPLELVSITQK